MDLDQIKQLAQDWALMQRGAVARTAACNLEIIETKRRILDAYHAEVAPIIERGKRLETDILNWIRAHKRDFDDVRTISTPLADFGLRASTVLKIDDDPVQVVSWLATTGAVDCYCPPKPAQILKPALKNRLARGEAVPGCRLEVRQVAFVETRDEAGSVD